VMANIEGTEDGIRKRSRNFASRKYVEIPEREKNTRLSQLKRTVGGRNPVSHEDEALTGGVA
jgi:hypothetical protein